VASTHQTLEIDQSQPRPETCTYYNCGKPAILMSLHKPWKQKIQLTFQPKLTSKSLMASCSSGDGCEEVAKRLSSKEQRRQRQIFRQVNGETHAHSTNRFSVLETVL